jgi:hypothetical protein
MEKYLNDLEITGISEPASSYRFILNLCFISACVVLIYTSTIQAHMNLLQNACVVYILYLHVCVHMCMYQSVCVCMCICPYVQPSYFDAHQPVPSTCHGEGSNSNFRCVNIVISISFHLEYQL